MFDVVFISNNEPHANENFQRLKALVPWAQRTQGADSIHQAHCNAAESSRTHWFFTVDGDNWITNARVFFGDPPWNESWNANAVGVCRATNPTNCLVYGWGGVKLWNKTLLEEAPEHYQDFTMTFPLYTIHHITSEHRYNVSSWLTWRTVVREIVKLKQQNNSIAQQRLMQWHQLHNEFDYRREYIHALNYALHTPAIDVNDWQTLRQAYERTFVPHAG
jgi:hypothetical protein